MEFDAHFWALIALILFFVLIIYMGVHRSVAGLLDKRADAIRDELENARRLRVDGKRVDAVVHQALQGRVHQPVTLDRQLAGKRRADDADVEMPLAVIGMPHVLVALVQHLEGHGLKRLLQALADLLGHGRAHAYGSALRNGWMATLA